VSARERTIRSLRRQRPRSRFLRASGLAAAALVVVAWVEGGFLDDLVLPSRRLANLHRFLQDLVPYPVRTGGGNWHTAADWAAGLWHDHYGAAAASTLAISIVAILLAGIVAAALALPAASNVMRPDPFLPSPRHPSRRRRTAHAAARTATRLLLVGLRAIPEYVWAFLLLALYGPRAWPLVLALGLHNAGVLGRLTADMVENLEQPTLAALRGVGATRAQVALAGIFPLSINRFLLYLFYRWETCVREATVLGMLGMVSLGFWIQDARARNRYDEMLLGIVIGGLLVLLGDLVSAVAREAVRRS